MSLKTAVVLGGRTGLVGQSLAQALLDSRWEVHPLGRADLDCTSESQVSAMLERLGPAVLFNTVAYTAVDKAEDEPEAAKALNARLPGMLARVCKRLGVKLVHYSTDFVFDGKADSPYAETAATNPASVYGSSKLAGERAIAESGLDDFLIIRTSWLFGPGKMNFVQRILELCADRPELNVVHDQVGSPTYTPDLAKNTVALVNAGQRGVFHVAGCGQASWCELAAEAVSLAGLTCAVKPIPSEAYPQKAARPAYSVLDLTAFSQATGLTPRPWPQALRDYVFSDLQLA